MHMGALAITGVLNPGNFKHIVLNNGAHDSVGGQPTAGFEMDILAIARACSYRMVVQAQTPQELQSGLQELKRSKGPGLLEVRIRCGARKDLGRPVTTPVENKRAFMDFIQGSSNGGS
jgi:phosphonopyruvate decarboxylase